MAEPLPASARTTRPVAATPEVEPTRGTPEPRLLAADAIEWERELATEDLDEPSTDFGRDSDEDDSSWPTPAVPPLEPAGSLSRAASLALFGHV